MKYERIPESTVPPGVRFDVAHHRAGQIVEVAYGGHDRDEHDRGDPYQRITDRSLPVGDPDRVRYFRKVQ